MSSKNPEAHCNQDTTFIAQIPNPAAPVIPNQETDTEKSSPPVESPVEAIDDPFLVSFLPTDPENPKDWKSSRKWIVTSLLAITGFNRIMVSTIVTPAITTISDELDMTSTESFMAFSIFALATAFGPLLIGPLSEIYGRQPIVHASNVWFLGWNLACGFAHSKGLLIASRFLAGFGASAIFALAGGVLGDIWRPEERGRSLGIYLLLPLLAPAVGPIIGGFINQYTTWRWMFWSTSIFQAIMIIVSIVPYHETYAPLILSRRVSKLRRETGDARYHTAQEKEDNGQPAVALVYQALSRPMKLLAFHPIIQITSLISAYWYGTLYIVLSGFSTLWTSQYHQPVAISGLHYIACALGEVAGSQIAGPLMDLLYRHMLKRSKDGQHKPEFRLPLAFPGGIFPLLGMFIYGWTAQYHAPWIAVDIGVFLVCMQFTNLPLQAYVMDAYPDHTDDNVPAIRSKGLSLRHLASASVKGALVLDLRGIGAHICPRNLNILLCVVATVDASAVRAAVAPAPAPTVLVAEGGVARHTGEVFDALPDGVDAGVAVSRDVTGELDLFGYGVSLNACP
ncbi:hypothetical protein VMCG_01762 [Cytospora schulzeri]|uniref:Major facilitator superfamily (MFS) profile domain-containing protein n=1 Tax=Cytospora schulzeri TaxID=448051 RepID=A0A423X3S3_9PEZI|nr:hypothetical protein VMCG_01762 [Valsa malicola]